MTRSAAALAAVLLLAAAAHAQPVQKTLPASPLPVSPLPTASLQVLSKEASAQEDPTVQSVLTRLRSKLSGDATFSSRLDAALTKGDLPTAGSLLGATLQLPRNSIVYGGASRASARDDGEGTRGLVRFASFDPDAWRNPWYLIFSVNGRVYCASTSAATCHDALHKMGYANTTQIW